MNFWRTWDDTTLLPQIHYTTLYANSDADQLAHSHRAISLTSIVTLFRKDKSHWSSKYELVYHMQGIPLILPSSIVGLFCNNKVLTITYFTKIGYTSPNSPLPSMRWFYNEQKSSKSTPSSYNFPKHLTRYHTVAHIVLSRILQPQSHNT